MAGDGRSDDHDLAWDSTPRTAVIAADDDLVAVCFNFAPAPCYHCGVHAISSSRSMIAVGDGGVGHIGALASKVSTRRFERRAR